MGGEDKHSLGSKKVRNSLCGAGEVKGEAGNQEHERAQGVKEKGDKLERQTTERRRRGGCWKKDEQTVAAERTSRGEKDSGGK